MTDKLTKELLEADKKFRTMAINWVKRFVSLYGDMSATKFAKWLEK